MIFSKKMFKFVHRIALFAILFASLAPTISHAIAAHESVHSFIQEVCNTSGQKIFIEVITSKGKQLQTGLDINSESHPASITHHMDHCPFCHAGMMQVVIPSQNATYAFYLDKFRNQQCPDYQAPVIQRSINAAHLTRAPPLL